MILQSWIIDCIKLYKISGEVIKFIEKTMKNWKVELTSRGNSLADVKIQCGIFQGDALSPLQFVIAMMPLNHILRECIGGYKFTKTQEKINHLMYMDDIKLFAKKEKELEKIIQAVRIYSQDILMIFGIEKRYMLIVRSGKRHIMEGISKIKVSDQNRGWPEGFLFNS